MYNCVFNDLGISPKGASIPEEQKIKTNVLIDPNQPNREVDEALLTGTADEVEVGGVDPTTSIFYNGGFMGTESDQEEISNMYPGATTPLIELRSDLFYRVQYKEVVEKLMLIEEVVEAHYTTGKYALFIKLYAKDNDHLMQVLNGKIQHIPGISQTETFISLEEPISRNLPV